MALVELAKNHHKYIYKYFTNYDVAVITYTYFVHHKEEVVLH